MTVKKPLNIFEQQKHADAIKAMQSGLERDLPLYAETSRLNAKRLFVAFSALRAEGFAPDEALALLCAQEGRK